MGENVGARGLVHPQFHAIQLKLDRSNYAFWRALVHSAIRAHGFDEFISATAEVPAPLIPGRAGGDMEPNPEFVTWIRRDQFLLSWMLSSVGESMLGHVVRCKSSREVWSALETVFHSHSKAQVSQYRVQLQSTKKGSMSVEDYFMKMRGIADQLAAIGKSLDDDELLQYILSGFGPEYESLVVNTMQRTDVSNLQEIQLAFQAYEVRLAHQHASVFDHSANVAYRRGSGGQNGQGFGQNGGNSGGRGQFPGGQQPGGRGAPRPNFGGKVLMCQLCGRSGHVALRCFKRFDIHFTGNESSGQTSGSAPNSAPKAYVTEFAGAAEHSAGFVDGEGNWFVDSGATTHVTNELGNLSINSQYIGGENLIVGNGQDISQGSAEGESN